MTHPQIDLMLDAQGIEKELIALKQQADAVSGPLEKTRARRQVMMQDLQAVKDKLDRVRQQRREAESVLDDAEARVKTAKGRMAEATSSRQVADLEHMQQTAEAAAATAEGEVLRLMEQEDTQSRRVEDETAFRTRDLEKLDEEIQRLSALLKEKQDLARALREERIAAINRLDPEVRENYEWLVKKHGPGQAVVTTPGAACGGCGAMLLPDQLNKVKDANQLNRCTHCHRYMIT